MSPWSIIRRIWRKGAPISLPRPHSSRTREQQIEQANLVARSGLARCPVPVRFKAFNISLDELTGEADRPWHGADAG